MKSKENESILLQHLNSQQYQSKTQLMIKTGMCDRTLRRTVENLRRGGHLIVSSDDPDTNGYKIASTPQEVYLIKHLYQKRIKTELETLCAMFGNEPIEQWLDQELKAIKKKHQDEINQVMREKTCCDCGQCNQFDGVCVYDMEV